MEQLSDNKNIPNHWQLKKLGEVCIYSKGKKPAALKATKTNDCAVPYINIKAFEKGIISEYTNGEKCNICNDDDLLMVWDGARCGLIGKAKKGAVGSTLMKILPKENIHKEYLYHFIGSKFRTLNTKPKGVGIPHIEPTLLWNFELVVPPLPEQLAIVSKIEELFSELDNGVAQLKTAQQQLKVYRQSLLIWAFEGKLTNKNVKNGELPKGWKRTTLGKLISISSGNGLSRNSRNNEGEYLVYGGNGVTGKHTEYLFENEQLIIGRVGVHCGNAHVTKPKSWVTDNAFVVSYDENEVSNYFLFHLIKVLNLNKYSVSTAQPVISQGKLYPIEVSFPPIEEQQLIVSELESKLTVCDKIEETISQSLQQAETLRQSILKKAFEGKLVNTTVKTVKSTAAV